MQNGMIIIYEAGSLDKRKTNVNDNDDIQNLNLLTRRYVLGWDYPKQNMCTVRNLIRISFFCLAGNCVTISLCFRVFIDRFLSGGLALKKPNFAYSAIFKPFLLELQFGRVNSIT